MTTNYDKLKESEENARLVEEYFARGGTIEYLPYRIYGEGKPKNPKLVNRFDVDSDE